MSVISAISPNGRNRGTTQERETSEYDGYWINIGVFMGDEEDSKFVRLPRGVAVSDLKTRKVYDNMDPEFAAQVTLMNQVISIIQSKCDGRIEEGGSIPLSLTPMLYRRQEEAEVSPTVASNSDLEAILFPVEETPEKPEAKTSSKAG